MAVVGPEAPVPAGEPPGTAGWGDPWIGQAGQFGSGGPGVPDALAAMPAAAAPASRGCWSYRPASFGEFMGFGVGSPLIDDWINQGQGPVGGYRLGYDWHPEWGWEMEIGLAAIALADSPRAIAAQQAADDALGLPADHPARARFDGGRDSQYFWLDFSLLYYPWGETRCRPYGRFGMGAVRVEFLDRLSVTRAGTVLGLPMALGVKYQVNQLVTVRGEVADHMTFGSGHGFNTLHNLSVTGGVEIRFGGPRKSYWPWDPGRHD